MKRGKSDALDAEAICEAVQRPTMRFGPIKTVEQQGILMTHRARSLLVRQRTMLANALRAHLAEMGLVANPGVAHLMKLAEQALADKNSLPSYARTALEMLGRRVPHEEPMSSVGTLRRSCARRAYDRHPHDVAPASISIVLFRGAGVARLSDPAVQRRPLPLDHRRAVGRPGSRLIDAALDSRRAD